MIRDQKLGEKRTGFKTAYESGQSNGSKHTAFAGRKNSNTVREKDQANPYIAANN